MRRVGRGYLSRCQEADIERPCSFSAFCCTSPITRKIRMSWRWPQSPAVLSPTVTTRKQKGSIDSIKRMACSTLGSWRNSSRCAARSGPAPPHGSTCWQPFLHLSLSWPCGQRPGTGRIVYCCLSLASAFGKECSLQSVGTSRTGRTRKHCSHKTASEHLSVRLRQKSITSFVRQTYMPGNTCISPAILSTRTDLVSANRQTFRSQLLLKSPQHSP